MKKHEKLMLMMKMTSTRIRKRESMGCKSQSVMVRMLVRRQKRMS